MEAEVKKRDNNRLGDLLDVLKRCWWLMVIVLFVSSTTMFIYSKITYKAQYTASISIWAMKNIGTDSNVQSADLSMATYMVNDYKLQLVGDEVVSRVQKAVANHKNYRGVSVSQLRGSVSVSHEDDTRILKLSVTARDPKVAKELADTWGKTFCTYINEDKFGEQMVTFDEALEPTAPSNSISMAKVLLVGLLGAAIVYGIFFLRVVLDDRINTVDDIEKHLGLTVLGAIPNKNAVLPKKSTHHRRSSSGSHHHHHHSH